MWNKLFYSIEGWHKLKSGRAAWRRYCARVGLKHGSVKTVHCLHSRFKPARAVSNDEYPTSIYSKKNIKWRLEPTTLFTEAGDVVQNEDTPISKAGFSLEQRVVIRSDWRLEIQWLTKSHELNFSYYNTNLVCNSLPNNVPMICHRHVGVLKSQFSSLIGQAYLDRISQRILSMTDCVWFWDRLIFQDFKQSVITSMVF